MISAFITHLEVPMEVIGSYHKGMSEVMYDSDLGGSPAEWEEFHISKVLVGGWDISNLISEDDFSEIEIKVIEYVR